MAMTKNEFVTKYINDMYKKKYEQRQKDKMADDVMISSATSRKNVRMKTTARGVLRHYGE